MAGKNDTPGWTLDTLHEHLLAKIDALEQMCSDREARNVERFSSFKEIVTSTSMTAEKAILKAEQATEKRFESVNEFRKTLSDQTAEFLRRSEYQVVHNALDEKCNISTQRIGALEATLSGKSQGISSVGAMVVGAIAVLSFLISAATLLSNTFKLH